MAICGKCGRYGTVTEIRACALQGTPHKGEMAVPKVKWGFKVTAEDIDNAPDSGGAVYEGELPPAGVYTFDAKTIVKTVADSGSDMLKILWLVNGKASGKKAYDGAPWWDNLVVMPSTMWKVKQFCAAVGISSADFLSMVVDDDGKVLKMGKLVVEKGVQLKASVKRSPNQSGDLRLEFGRYVALHDTQADAAPATSNGAESKPKKAKAGKEPTPEPAAATTAGKKATKGKGKKSKGDEPPF